MVCGVIQGRLPEDDSESGADGASTLTGQNIHGKTCVEVFVVGLLLLNQCTAVVVQVQQFTCCAWQRASITCLFSPLLLHEDSLTHCS